MQKIVDGASAGNPVTVRLIGGPTSIADAARVREVGAHEEKIKLPHQGGYEHFERVGALQLIADNACAHYFVLGRPAPDSWRSLDLAQYKVRGLRNGALAETGQGANVLGDPRFALTWLANELSRFGRALKKDQVVMTGTCVKPMVIAAGDRMEGDFGQLGTVSVEIR